MSDSDNTGAFLAGFLLGGLVGAAAALLMTPQSGEQTRLQLQERSAGLKTQFDDLAVDPRGQASKIITDARGRAEKLTTQIQERGKVIFEERLQSGDGAASLDEQESESPADQEST